MPARRDLDFDAFVEFQFGPAIRVYGNPWYFDIDADWWDPDPQTGIRFLTRLFSEGAEVLHWFSDEQIAQGLTGLINIEGAGDQPWMCSPSTPAAERAAVWTAIASFFASVLAPRCSNMLGRLAREIHLSPINTLTYMWWENFPRLTTAEDPLRGLVEDAELDALRQILKFDSIACQEAALHGLGHLVGKEPRCAAIIDDYLAVGTAPPELLAYARAARSGCIQ